MHNAKVVKWKVPWWVAQQFWNSWLQSFCWWPFSNRQFDVSFVRERQPEFSSAVPSEWGFHQSVWFREGDAPTVCSRYKLLFPSTRNQRLQQPLEKRKKKKKGIESKIIARRREKRRTVRCWDVLFFWFPSIPNVLRVLSTIASESGNCPRSNLV